MKKLFTFFCAAVLVATAVFADNDLPLIAVDGDFADWGALNPASIAEASTDENARDESLYNMKFTRDADYIYFYFEFSGTADEVSVFEIMMNVDGDVATGHDSWMWSQSGIEYLIEGAAEDLSEAGLFIFTGATPDAWAWGETGVYEFLQASAVQTLGNGHHAIEGTISRSALPATMQSLQVGVFANDSEWATSGSLPQVTIDPESGSDILQPMLDVPVYEIPSSIGNVVSMQDSKVQKVVRNGNLYILRGDKTYTLHGQEVK